MPQFVIVAIVPKLRLGTAILKLCLAPPAWPKETELGNEENYKTEEEKRNYETALNGEPYASIGHVRIRGSLGK